MVIQAQLRWRVLHHILVQALWQVEALEDLWRVALIQAQLPRRLMHHILPQALWRVEDREDPLRQGRDAGAVDVSRMRSLQFRVYCNYGVSFRELQLLENPARLWNRTL